MSIFTLHTVESAPEGSKPSLEAAKKNMGAIPGLYSVMAESPETLKAYQQIHQLFTQTSFNAEELTVVWQTINVEHRCHYCVPAHTGIAYSMKVSPDIIDALRNETPLPSGKLEALRTFTLAMVRTRGEVSTEEVQRFLDAGYTKQQILEVILGLSQKVISNYVNHIAETPVDPFFEKYRWQPAGNS